MKQAEMEQSKGQRLYGISESNIEKVSRALALGDRASLMYYLPHHSADIADLIEALEPAQRIQLIHIIRKHLEPHVLSELEGYFRESVLSVLTPEEIAKALSALDTNEAMLLLEELDKEQQDKVFSYLSTQSRAELNSILSYPPDSAGRLMRKKMVVVPQHWTVGEVQKLLQDNTALPETFYDLFVVDEDLKPVGLIPVSHLFKHHAQESVQDIMIRDIKKIPATMDQEDVAHLFQQYGLISAPVVDPFGRLVGNIVVEDMVNIIQKEATEDIMRMGGVDVSDFQASAGETSIWRFRWLLVTFIDALLASSVIYQFQETLEQIVALAILMPIVAAMGGNAGMQVVTVMVRAIATHAFRPARLFSILKKEMTVAAINGILFASLLAGIAGFWFHDFDLALVLGAAMIFNMLWAGVAGTLLPFILHRLGFDPATSAGPLLTTTTDVLGFASFLGLATLFLK